ncbi:hypothetical protein [Marinigracilibium pacificum]|uniref:Uncharacterized protein n=1 Tax=Marinigracilibium pacificum TaxID=2729599 RepID=A0A848J5P1_9BACT|nr:hypothetical protein [Marinigracilibium pacificum]NMM50785.1 hypothetical protein [Marinigracilibium pacificum]
MADIIKAIFIYLIIPFTGLMYYLGLKRKMKAQEIPAPPAIELFIIFTTYGGLLLVTLTTLFWKWSAMASLGTFFLILVAPVIMGIIVF